MSETILTGRRNFLVRAIGLAALPAAASVPVVAMPTISPEIIGAMHDWRQAYHLWRGLYDEVTLPHARLHTSGSKLTPFGQTYYDAADAEMRTRLDMLALIQRTL